MKDTKKHLRLLEAQISQLKKKIAEQRRINEVLASPYKFIIRTVDRYIKAKFSAAAADYTYHMMLQHVIVNGELVIVGNIVFTDENDGITLTGKGDAFKVLATVLEITKQAVRDRQAINRYRHNKVDEEVENIPDHIEVLTFSADVDEPSRVRLYEKLARSTPGYTLVRVEDGDFIVVSNKMPQEKVKDVLDAIETDL
jgi:hypothetical protein